jgi:hypothetical protein
MLQVPNAAAQLMVDPLLGHGISASREESEKMYSGAASIPMISSGSRSRLRRKKNKEEVKREITQEIKKLVEGELTLESCVSLERCLPWAACLCP